MEDKELYLVNVSSLTIYTNPNKPSKVSLKRNTVLFANGETKKYRFNEWIPVITKDHPVISGYVLKKFLKKM